MRGRPRHEPTAQTRDMVEALAGFGVSSENIALVLGISDVTLRKRYRKQLDVGFARVEARLISNLLRLSSGTDGTALKATMFALQARFGWSIYASTPVKAGEKEPKIGKKEQANIDAATGHEDTSWGEVLN